MLSPRPSANPFDHRLVLAGCPGGNGEVIEEAVHHPLQVEPLLRPLRPVHHPPYRLLDLPELLPQPFTNGVPEDEEVLPLLVPQMCVNTRKAKFRLAEAPELALARREPPEFDDPGCADAITSPNLCKRCRSSSRNRSASERCWKPNDVVGIADDDHLAGGASPPPLVDPHVEDVEQIDVREDR